MLNSVNIMGRLTAAPELKFTQSNNAVMSFSVACDRDYVAEGKERECDFINCVAWRKTAEFISKYFEKGQTILIAGRLQTRSYDKNGEKRFVTEVLVDNAYFAGNKRNASQGDTAAPAPSEAPPQYKSPYEYNEAQKAAKRDYSEPVEYRQQTFAEANIDEIDLPF